MNIQYAGLTDFGFTDFKKGELNPAGVPTVVMWLEKSSKMEGRLERLHKGYTLFFTDGHRYILSIT